MGNVIKEQKGMAIPMVLVFMAVLMMLGTALMQFSTAEAIQVARGKDKKQAYYVARTGADATAAWIIGNYNDVSELNAASYLPFNGTGYLDYGNFKVNVEELDNGKLRINSRGFAGNTSDIVNLTVVPQDLFDNAMFGTAFINLKGSVIINGNLECNGTITFDGTAYTMSDEYECIENSERIYPEVDPFPENNSTEIIDVSNGITHPITSESSYDKINVKNGGTLSFNVSTDTVVIVNDLDVKGSLKVEGTGTLYLYVRNFVVGGNGKVVNNADSTSLIVLLPPNGLINFGGSPEFRGIIYGPNATATFSGDTEFTGSLIAGEVVNNGNPTVNYDPAVADLSPDDIPVDNLFTGLERGVWS